MPVVAELVYHSCGHRLVKRTRWNGLTNVVVFDDDQGGDQDVIECPGCGETLLPNDLGITIFTPLEWQYEIDRRQMRKTENDDHKRGRQALVDGEPDECTQAFMEAYGVEDFNGPDGETHLGWLGVWVRAWKSARRQAMEDVCSALCVHCRSGDQVEDWHGIPYHNQEDLSVACDAWSIRAMMRKEERG